MDGDEHPHPRPLSQGERGEIDGVFLWSFYRGKDSDLCLREMLAYAEGLDRPPDVSARSGPSSNFNASCTASAAASIPARSSYAASPWAVWRYHGDGFAWHR